ncbi:hypothetical protein CABS03_04920 [Colletotrichum abscissum]|uniref:Uncharacterized protein n=1 Tax=Colletotrichum abscissum TaxID=1671311 RepID=A0A9P9X202_9PEZI|nr:hypothetical protein CABS02_14116 [Colletotrichum abscissum]
MSVYDYEATIKRGGSVENIKLGEAEENTVGLVKLWQRKSIKQLPEILQLVGQPLLAPLASMFAANGFFPHDIDRLLESSFDGGIEDNDWPEDFR